MKWLALIPRPTRGYPHHEVSRHALSSDTPATLSTPATAAHDRRSGHLPSHSRLCSNSTGGTRVTEVAVQLGVSRRTVHGWIATYRHHPVPGSLVTHHSTGRPSEWDEDARAILRASLDQPPDHFGYQATAWTIPLLQSHLAHWGLTGFCDATLRRQLHALGYVWKRPRYVLDPDPRRAAKMRRIRRYIKGLGPRDVVLFEDETDLLLFPPLRACWARRGEDAEVPLCGANAKRVLFGALNPSNGTRLFLERKKQRKEDFQEFLGLIHEQYRGWQVSLVLDGDSSHTAKASQRDARRFGNPTGLAAGPMSRTEPDGSPVAPWQGANLCQPAVRVDRGTGASLPPLSGGIICTTNSENLVRCARFYNRFCGKV